MGPHAGVDYNVTLLYVHSRVDSNTFTMVKLMPESTLKVLTDHSNWEERLGSFDP
jgi:hypothetical protein